MNQTVAHYKLIRQLGAGAAAQVFLAEDLRNAGKQVALKLLHTHLLKNVEQVKRFELEAEWISLLNHPNVPSIYEVGRASDYYFMATEYVEGESLRHLVLTVIPIARVLDISMGVAAALTAAHEQWIVHRDIKPENIMIGLHGEVKVVDFGFAKLTRPTGESIQQKLTRPGTILGTMHYMAPEQIVGWAVDPRTDIYSLGVVMFEMITGFPPFDAETNRDLLQQILRSDPPAILDSRPDAPPELEALVQRCLRKDAEERFQTSKELLAELTRIRNSLDS